MLISCMVNAFVFAYAKRRFFYVVAHKILNNSYRQGNGPKSLHQALTGPRCEKTGLRGFRPGRTQTGLYSHRIWLEA